MGGFDELAELRALNKLLLERVGALTVEVEELRRRLGQNSANSSRPPSTDPPQAPKRPARKGSGRKRGGQSGHEGHHREMVADPDETVEHLPGRCDSCDGDLGDAERVGDPVCHQVWELPRVVCSVTEHQRVRVRCACCGKLTLAPVPAGVPAGAFGPNLSATIVGLSLHMSREQVARFITDSFGCPISAASVEAVCKRASDALAEPYEQLAAAVPAEPVLHMDETGWRWPSQRRWAWVATNDRLAVYRLCDTRAAMIAKELLGENYQGLLVSDRYGAYSWITPPQRQACWAHLLRDFQALAERDGRPGVLGQKLKQTAAEILTVHRQAAGQPVRWDQEPMLALHDRLMDLLEQGSRMRDAKTSRFCGALLDLWPALWNFTEHAGLDPTNNRAERALRFLVLWRKRSGGTRVEHGDRLTERIMTVRETCRLQGRNLHDYLNTAITNALHGQAAPSLLPAGS